MTRAFSRIAYTPSVRRIQERHGSRAANARLESDLQARDCISPRDHAFIENVDTFFMASVGETGWPYVQHRGGPPGFLKVLDEYTIGFADFSGNRQYISTGNIEHDDRVTLILMDFARRGRLKIWGRCRIVHEADAPALLARLEVPTYRARVERGFVITVEACDFNCPQHITQRFSEQDLVRMAGEPEARAWLRRLLEQGAGQGPEPAPLASTHHEGVAMSTPSAARAPLPPFTRASAIEKVRLAEDAWNSRDPERVSLAYAPDSAWRNRSEFVQGREQIVQFLGRKWARERDYRLIKELWTVDGNRIAVRYAYEWHDAAGNWYRSYGNEHWEFDAHGLMTRRFASINDLPIEAGERKFHWPLGRRPDDHPGLSELGL